MSGFSPNPSGSLPPASSSGPYSPLAPGSVMPVPQPHSQPHGGSLAAPPFTQITGSVVPPSVGSVQPPVNMNPVFMNPPPFGPTTPQKQILSPMSARTTPCAISPNRPPGPMPVPNSMSPQPNNDADTLKHSLASPVQNGPLPSVTTSEYRQMLNGPAKVNSHAPGIQNGPSVGLITSPSFPPTLSAASNICGPSIPTSASPIGNFGPPSGPMSTPHRLPAQVQPPYAHQQQMPVASVPLSSSEALRTSGFSGTDFSSSGTGPSSSISNSYMYGQNAVQSAPMGARPPLPTSSISGHVNFPRIPPPPPTVTPQVNSQTNRLGPMPTSLPPAPISGPQASSHAGLQTSPAAASVPSPNSRYPQPMNYAHSGPPASHPAIAPSLPPPPPTISSSLQYSGTMTKLEGPVGGVEGYNSELHASMAGMSINSSFSRMWGTENVNLLQDRNVLPPHPTPPPKPCLPQDKPNCSTDIFRCTLTKIPDTHSLLQKCRLPFGVVIHPFRDVNQLPVIQCGAIVRCRACRTYINPFVSFVDQRRWKCNLCFRTNDLPEEFLYDPLSRTYGDPSRRPEIRNATVEFIAPSEYMLRPPQPAVYLFVLDVSHTAIQTGYLVAFCKTLLEELSHLPGDSRTQVGFITFDSSIHFYNLGDLNQPHMLIVSDIEDVFLPCPDNLLVNLQEGRSLIEDLLNHLPTQFSHNGDTNSALGAALQAAFKLMAPTGGRISVMQCSLPNIGPGALKPREDPNQRAGKEVAHLGPASDFYKKLALDCSGHQIAVDLFLLSTQYTDIATLSCISKFSAGSLFYYPGFHIHLAKTQVEKYSKDLHRYLTRKIGFEAVMRIRCTRGLSIHTFHGNFFVRSTDLLSLANVNPDAGFAMQIAIEESLTDCSAVCFQAAVLYTSSKGERRIRVHTLSLPVVSLLTDVIGGADQEAVIGLLAKMAVDRSISASLTDARDALINACIDLIKAYGATASGSLTVPLSCRLMPLLTLGLLKHVAFRVGISTKLDERVYAMEMMKTVPLTYLILSIYPHMYAVHSLNDKNCISEEDAVIPQPPRLQLSYEKIDRHGAYLVDTLDCLYLYVCKAISDHFCANVLGVPNFSCIPDDMHELPELKTPESDRLQSFVSWLHAQRPFHSPLVVLREDSKDRYKLLQHLVDDRTESAYSYYEFLQHLKQQITK